MENSGDIRCSIVLPPESLVKTVKGWACSTRTDAKQSACFEACKQLHEAGGLSDLFLINSDDPENDDMDFLAADDDDTPAGLWTIFWLSVWDSINIDGWVVRTQSSDQWCMFCFPGKEQQELHPLFVPDVFQGSWSLASSCVTLYGYTIKFVPKPSDRSYTNFRLFVESDLGEEVVNSPLQLELQSQRVVEAQCSSAGKLEFEPDQVSSIYLSIYSQQLCMHTLWGLIFLWHVVICMLWSKFQHCPPADCFGIADTGCKNIPRACFECTFGPESWQQRSRRMEPISTLSVVTTSKPWPWWQPTSASWLGVCQEVDFWSNVCSGSGLPQWTFFATSWLVVVFFFSAYLYSATSQWSFSCGRYWGFCRWNNTH